MKAYKVFYQTAGSSNSAIVLVGENETLEEALANKDKAFAPNERWSKINSQRELPLSTVLISDLSITEFKAIMKI